MSNLTDVKVASVAEFGLLLRAARKLRRTRQDELARQAQVGHVFVRDVEHGKPTVQMGRALKLLESVGLELKMSVSPDVKAMRDKLASKIAASKTAGRRDETLKSTASG